MAPPGIKSSKPTMATQSAGPKPPGIPEDEGLDHVEEHDEDKEGGKATREKALYIPEDHHCGQCVNYEVTSGECSKVEGYFEPEAACLRYFKHVDESDEEKEPDADDMGGPSDGDADDIAE